MLDTNNRLFLVPFWAMPKRTGSPQASRSSALESFRRNDEPGSPLEAKHCTETKRGATVLDSGFRRNDEQRRRLVREAKLRTCSSTVQKKEKLRRWITV